MKTIGLKLTNEKGEVYFKGNKSEQYYKDDFAFESGIGICYVPKKYMSALEVVYKLKDDFISEDTLVNAGVAYRRQDIFKIVDNDIKSHKSFNYNKKEFVFSKLEHYDEFVVYMVNHYYKYIDGIDLGEDFEKSAKVYSLLYINFCKKHGYKDLEMSDDE